MDTHVDRSAVKAEGGPFRSLEALRAAHEELLETADASLEPSSPGGLAREQRIADFMSSAAATGEILDAPADRRMAQGFIDYWAASFYTSSRTETADGGTPTPNRYSPRTRLAPFNAHLVKDIEQQGEQILAKLNSKGLDHARRILMHLIRLSEHTGVCVGVPAKRSALLALGNVTVGRSILDQLIEAGVLKQMSSEEGDIIELRHDALTRKWNRLARWIEERIKLREAARFWDRGGRKRDALLSFGLARQADAYGDLNELELEFLAESKRHSVIFTAAAVSAAVLLMAAPLLYNFAYREFWVPYWVNSVTENVKSRTSTARTKSDGILWLARNNQQLNFSNTSLENINLSNAQLGRPIIFAGATLNGVNFDNARLDFSIFRSATIARTTFVNTRLYGSSFDGSFFCNGVDFSNTDLRATTFRNVEFEKDTAPIVKSTAWWLAQGWTWEQVKILLRQDRSELQKSRAFQDATTDAERFVQTSPAKTLVRVDALNNQAWILALFGAELDHAESAAREALAIVADVGHGGPPGACR